MLIQKDFSVHFTAKKYNEKAVKFIEEFNLPCRTEERHVNRDSCAYKWALIKIKAAIGDDVTVNISHIYELTEFIEM